jgi:hypothetical protein
VRLWTIHPQYLDAKGLVALWREALLAQAVLRGRTRGYRHHPQLTRFRAAPSPIAAIATYLRCIQAEATTRGYTFDHRKIARTAPARCIAETNGQLAYEWDHLCRKLQARSPAHHKSIRATKRPKAHPLFILVRGEVREWEIRE